MVSITDSKNLLVDWLNKRQSPNVQTNVLKKSATNTKDTWIKLPNSTANTNLKDWTKNKLQQKWIVQPTTTTTNTRQQILDNDPNIQKIKQLWLQNDVRYAAAQQNQSRFIWLQNNNLNNNQNKPLTDLAWNVIQGNLDEKRKSEFNRILNKPVLEIPTKKSEIENYNKKESERYRTDEQVIKDFHYDVRNSNWTLTKEQISQLYPEFQGKEDIALMLQADLLPLVQNDEFADMRKLAEVYPELLPKQKKVWDQILKDQEKQGREIKDLAKKAEKTLSRYNVLSKNWQQYMEDVYQLGNFVDTIRAEYRLPWNPSDLDIINFGKERLPEVKELLDDMERLKSNYNLTERDRDIILNNWFDIWEWLYQAWADIQNFTQHNQLWDYLDKKSSTWERQLSNLWINGGSANTIANLPKKAVNTAEIPVNMFGGLTSWVGKVWIATERIATQQNRNEDWTTDYNGIVKDVIRWWWGALDVAFNSVMAIPTAIFHLAEETDAGSAVIDSTLWEATRWIDNILNWETLEKAWLSKENNPLAKRYNDLDEETQADLTNEITVAVFHKWSKIVKDLKERWELWVEAVNNAFMKSWKDPKRWKAVESFKENWIMDENWKVTPWNRKEVARVVAKEFTNTFKENLKTNFRMYNTVLRNRRWKTTVKDNRTFREKSGEKAYNAGVKAREIYDSVKGWVETVKEWVQNINVWDAVKNTAEMVGKWVKATSDLYNKWKNAVTKWKNKVTSAVKNTINENIVEPYNKGRWKTTVNKWTVKQEWQPQESNSTLKSDTKVNWDNYTEKKTNSKTLNNTQLQIQQNENRMNPSEIREFKNRYKKDYWQVMYEWWFTKTRDENIDDMWEYINNLIKEKSDSISSIEWTYKDKRLAKMIKYMIRYASKTQDDAMFDKYNKLSSKHSKGWITTKEADDMRKEFSYKIKTWFWNDKNSEKIALATNLYSGVKDVLDEIAEANWFTDMRKINDEIAMRQHIRKWMIDKADWQSANNVYWINDYILMAEAFSNPETATLFVWKQLLKNKKIRNKVLNATVWWRKNAKNRITSESRQEVKNKIKSIAEWKKLQESMRWWKQPALPEYIKFSKITEIDKRKTTSEDTTPPTEWDTTEKKSETPKKESKPKNKVTAKKPVEKKTEAKTEAKPESKEEVKTETKEQVKEETKTDNVMWTEKWLDANWFGDIDTKWINLNNIDVEKMSKILNKTRDYRLWQDTNGEYRVWYWEWNKPQEKVNGDEAQLLMNIRDNVKPEQTEWFTWDKALTGAKIWEKKNVVTKKSAVTTKQEPKTNWGMKKQTGKSRAAKFTNTILDIIESNGWLKDWYLKVEKSGFEPLYIEEIWGGKIAIGQTYIQNWDVMFDPEIVFNVDDNWKLVATSYRNDSIWIYNKPMSPNSEFFDTWGENLKMFIKWEEKSESAPKEEVKTEEKPETKQEIKTPTEKDEITWQKKSWTKSDSDKLKETRTLNDLKDEYWLKTFHDSLPIVNAYSMKEEWGIVRDYYYGRIWDTNVIFSEEHNYERKIKPNAPEYIYRAWVGWAIVWGDNGVPPMMTKADKFYEWWDTSAVIDKLGEYLDTLHGIDKQKATTEMKEDTQSVDNKENTNIIGKNNSLTTNNTTNGQKLWANEQGIWQSNWWNRWELRNEVSNVQPTESTKAWLQRTSDTNGDRKLNTSWKQADISWNGLTTWPESTRLTVGQQRKINEDSRNILEKHNFSTNRSDYTPEELETLFKYEWNGGLAKAGDENVKGTRYEFYTPKNAVSALQRWIQKYSDSPINSVEDPTAWKWNMLDWYGENIDKYMYEISPVSWTIAKLRFPEAKVWIWEKDWDFQRRYLNYQWQKAYDTPRDWGHNVDAVLLNPPFWKRITIKDEPQIKSLEDYFTKRAIEHDLKDWWMVGLLMPSRWLKASDSYTKKWLDEHTQIVDAYRLPAWVFSYTDVGTDLIILKKVSWADNKWWFIDDNYFKENPDKVLWVEKERTGRHGMETYIEWDPKVIETLRQDSDIVPSQMNAVTDTTNKAAITSKKAVENKPKNLVTNPPKEDAKFTPDKKSDTTAKPKTENTEKKPATRKSKNAKQTISKWDKTDIGTYTVNWNEKAYEYQDVTDADGFVDRVRLDEPVTPEKVAQWVDLLNYIDGRIQTDYLYYSWDIYAKLKQLEKDKPQMSDEQYKKQKEWLEAILPSKLSVWDITWSPTDKALLGQETDMLYSRRDPELREDVEEKMTIKEAFKKWLSNLPSDQFQWTDTSYRKIRDYIDWKRRSPERITKRYSETDEEFEMRKKAKKAEEEQKKQATKERAKTFFNDFIKEQLSPEIQEKITESYNTRLRAVVKPDYKNMPLSIKNMSATFHGKPLKIDPVQIEWINAMLSKWTMLIAHWVGYGKTLEWVVATIGSVQKGWTKKPLFIVPKWTREDWIKTIQDLFPEQEIVDLWWLTTDDIKRLKRDLGNDVKNWIKDGQVAIVTHNWFDNQINFKWNTQQHIESDLRDVMEKADSSARQEDALQENIKNMADTMNTRKDTKKLKWIKGELSEKYWDELLEDIDHDLGEMDEAEFVENFVKKTKLTKLSEEELRADAHRMYETKPIYIEDLGIDHITVDEVHNYKNIFTSAKSNYKKWESPEEVNPYGKISGSSSARWRKMFAASQYILKSNGWRWVFSLSATPFNNQPIEVYNMLSLHAYNRLVEKGIQNINSFFDYFADFRNEWIANPLKKWWWEFGEVMKDFNNLPEMQRLIWEYVDYVWDNPNLVRPEKRMKKVILTPSEMQTRIQQRLQQEEKRMNANGEWDSVLPIYNDMRLNLISPYLTSYGKLEDAPTWEEFIETSPKLKFAVDTIKALRDEGQNDWVFIYMPLWVEYHSLLKEAIENIVGKDRVKVWIINGTTSWSETVDWEKVEKRIAIAEKFRKWELNVLIWWRNTSEWINLQDNWFITINTLIGWNPTEITQLNGRIHRQGNLRDHVIELLPLLTNWWDVMMMQKYDEKANRINNIFNAQWRTFNLEELDPEEEKMALNTDPVRKAELSIDMDKKRIQRDIQKLSWQNGTLKEIITKMPKDDEIKELEWKISKKQEELKQINEWMKALDPESAAYRTLESERSYVERNIKTEKERIKKLEKDKARAENRMQSYSIDNIEWVQQRIAENEAKLDDLIEQEKAIQWELQARVEKFTKDYEEWKSNMKSPEEYLDELREDFRSKKIFGDREGLKQHLEEQKKQKEEEKKNKVTWNWKNKITNW